MHEEDIILKMLAQYGIIARFEDSVKGPTFTQYIFGFERGTFRSAVLRQGRDFAYNLDVESVRLVPPSPEDPYLYVEVPNKIREAVLYESMTKAMKASDTAVPMALGKDVNGESIVIDVASAQHLLLLGDAGSGKTACIHGLVKSVLDTRTAEQVQLLIADCTACELHVYNGQPHLVRPIMTKPEEVLQAFEWLCGEMERRMVLFKDSGAKGIVSYNESAQEKLPYLVFVIHEFGDLMVNFLEQFEYWIKRITAVARFCGIHLVLSAEDAGRDIVSKVISYNIPSRILFRISNLTGTDPVLVDRDAANLLGRGDMLWFKPYQKAGKRVQGLVCVFF